jgi:hypothetical protein
MKYASPRIQFCDEYEELLTEFLKGLATCCQLRDLNEQLDSANALANTELARGGKNYVAALWALRMHSRKCLACQETLRLYLNRDTPPMAKLKASCT